MAKGDRYTLGFSAAVCLVCSLLLATVASGLRHRQAKLAEWARQMNVLRAFGADLSDAEGNRLPMEQIGQRFQERVEPVWFDAQTGRVREEPPPAEDPAPAVLPLYRWRVDGEIARYAFPLSGQGLWGPIRGYIALERDGITIAGITFYDHQETPGLGAEIEQDWFQAQFRGKTVYAEGERKRIEVVKGAVRDRYPDGNPHAVDGISGATLTGQGVTRLINDGLDRYELLLRRLREP